jgi:peptidoglycan/LPS O-acetylase OafA/YrhL
VLGPVARTVLAHGNEVWQEYSYLGGMDAIALGCLAALLNVHWRWSQRAARRLGMIGTGLLILMFCFSNAAQAMGLDRSGLDMTALALGVCMVAVAASRTGWRGPRFLRAFVVMGQRSYEIYLTHMFVVFALFDLFVSDGRPLAAVPLLFIATIACAALLGGLVARGYSEPVNRLLRRRLLPDA